MKKIIVVGILLLVNTFLFAIENKTKLVVGITIDQFYPEWLYIYKGNLSDGGLNRIMSKGYQSAMNFDYLFSQTGVDHASIYTGLLPSAHGIVSHEWYDRLRNKRQNNIKGDGFSTVGGGSNDEGFNPSGLQALTLGCAMKMNNVFSKVYSISINGEGAVLSGGNCANMAFWFSEDNGKWVTSDYYTSSLPDWLIRYNSKMESDFFIRRGWMPLGNETVNSTALKLKSKVGLGRDFFYDLDQTKQRYNTYRILKATPYANSMVVDLATELIKSEYLGQDNDVDLLTLDFSTLDYMNRDFYVYSPEFQDLVIRLDRDVERLIKALDERVGQGNYTIFLTFTEARELLPEELQKMRISAEYFSIFRAVALLKSYLSLIYGPGDWIADYDAGQIYLDRGLLEKNKVSIKDMQDKIADFLIEFEGVARVLTAHSLTHNSSSSGVEVLFQNSFSQKRSGDVLYALEPTWVPILKDREDTYARYSKRNKVPFFMYGAGAEPLKEESFVVDILPTLCKLINIPVPYTASGEIMMK